MSETVDRVASALRAAGGLHNPADAEALARVAIEAMREPTPAMVAAGEAVYAGRAATHRAMIDAALAH